MRRYQREKERDGHTAKTSVSIVYSKYVADLPSRRRGRLRSSTSSLLDVRPSRLVTVGDRSLAAAGLDVSTANRRRTYYKRLKQKF